MPVGPSSGATPSERATAGRTSPRVLAEYAGSTKPSGNSASCPGGQALGELQELVDLGLPVRGGADPQREVVGGQDAGVAVVRLALGVGAPGRLEVEPA